MTVLRACLELALSLTSSLDSLQAWWRWQGTQEAIKRLDDAERAALVAAKDRRKADLSRS